MKVLTKELKGDALDWAVAKAKGWIDYPEDCAQIEEAKGELAELIAHLDKE